MPVECPFYNVRRIGPADGKGSQRNPLHRTARWTRDAGCRIALQTPHHKAGTGSRRSIRFLSAGTRTYGHRQRASERVKRKCRTRQETRFVINRGVSRYGVRMLPNPAPRRGLVPKLKLSHLHGRTRPQPTRRHPYRTRRRHDQDAQRQTRLYGGVSRYVDRRDRRMSCRTPSTHAASDRIDNHGRFRRQEGAEHISPRAPEPWERIETAGTEKRPDRRTAPHRSSASKPLIDGKWL